MTKSNIAWVDLLRVVACFLVVLAHCCDPFVAQFDNNYPDFLAGGLWGSFLRPCVPLFVMISGVLLLPVTTDMNTFYRKRLTRVIVPLFVWSVVTPILFYLFLNSGIKITSPNIEMSAHTWEATVSKLWSFIFNFNYDIIPLWYLYMLVGIYLILPIISAWLTQAPKKDVQKFLWIWVFSTTLPYIQMAAPLLGYDGNYGNMGLLGVCDWNAYGTFYYFSGFLGYVVLAYYLTHYPLEWSWRKRFAVALPLFLVGYAITSLGFILTQKYFPGNYAELEIVWYFSGANVLMMTFAMFIIIQNISVRSSKFLRTLSSLTFGVYLCHFLVVLVFYELVYNNISIAPALQIPLIAILSFAATSFFVWILSKLPFRKYIIG